VNRQWQWNYRIRVLVGLAAGAIVGIAVYGASRLSEPWLFVLAGAAGGIFAVLVIQLYSQSAQLTDITLTIPQFSELHFAVTRDSRQVAWKLFVESVTRITTQPLDPEGGLLREALTSIYGLFAVTRDVLKQAQPSPKTGNEPTVEYFAIAMLNNELRPFLTRWHPALLQWENDNPGVSDSAWPRSVECRSELAGMQGRLADYVLGFAKLAGLANGKEILDGVLGLQPTNLS
jgi:hypothetical protein